MPPAFHSDRRGRSTCKYNGLLAVVVLLLAQHCLAQEEEGGSGEVPSPTSSSTSTIPPSSPTIMTTLPAPTPTTMLVPCSALHYRSNSTDMCVPCDCSIGGTASCDSKTGACSCKSNHTGMRCESCTSYHYLDSSSSCQPCNCSTQGSVSCDPSSGTCSCRQNWNGSRCDICPTFFYVIPGLAKLNATDLAPADCLPCMCHAAGTQSCNNTNGVCHCKPGYNDMHCTNCSSFHRMKNGVCTECNCSKNGSLGCDSMSGNCQCRPTFQGSHCDQCSPYYYTVSPGVCKKCNCSGLGSVGCNANTGKCMCASNWLGERCDICPDFFYTSTDSTVNEGNIRKDCNVSSGNCTAGVIVPNTSRCRPCNCDMNGTRNCDGQTGRCICKNSTHGSQCDQCSELHYRKTSSGACLPCNCSMFGTQSCNAVSGKCSCQGLFTGTHCNECVAGYYSISYGTCVKCGCGNGTVSCNSTSGQCHCGPNWQGTGCNICPSFHHVFKPNGLNASVGFSSNATMVNQPEKMNHTLPGISNGFQNVALCEPCNCTRNGTESCDRSTGQCRCHSSAAGLHCEHCAVFHFKSKIDASCRQCDCSVVGSLNCNASNGQCACRPNHLGLRCDQCAPFHYRSKNGSCLPCQCNRSGSSGCVATSGACICGPNWSGSKCDICPFLHYVTMNAVGLSNHSGTQFACSACPCNASGTQSCDAQNGTCHCRPHVGGSSCSVCQPGYFQNSSLPNCHRCLCHPLGSLSCDQLSGACTCRQNIVGTHCNKCSPGFYSTPAASITCLQCNCTGAGSTDCNSTTGQCTCRQNWAGSHCEHCSPQHFLDKSSKLSECQPCNCSSEGTVNCSSATNCNCIPNVAGPQCTRCANGTYRAKQSLTSCQNCDCYGPGSLGCNWLTGQCMCQAGYSGPRCSLCSQHWYFLDSSNVCRPCQCNTFGSQACNNQTGQCSCRPFIGGSLCDRCSVPGTDAFTPLDQCDDCQCVDSGTVNCNTKTGVCNCHPHVAGLSCDRCAAFAYTTSSLQQCTPCSCEVNKTISCSNVTGVCSCRTGSFGPTCSQCSEGYYSSDTGPCQRCTCNAVGAVGCHNITGSCICRPNVQGKLCTQCDRFFYSPQGGLDQCTGCACDVNGATSCNQQSGACICRPNVGGIMCSKCTPFHYRNTSLANCVSCGCNPNRSVACSELSGVCACADFATGSNCENCVPGYFKHPGSGRCVPCNCDPLGSIGCNQENGKCNCRPTASGDRCDSCIQGHFRTGAFFCRPCACNVNGTELCDPQSGLCTCRPSVTGVLCDSCASFHYSSGTSVSRCTPCNCSQQGSSSCGGTSGICHCRNTVQGSSCNSCQPNFFQNTTLANCVRCSCFSEGTAYCNQATGVCVCRQNVTGARCNECVPGYFARPTVASCAQCECNTQGARECDRRTGACVCHPNVGGRLCSKCALGYYRNPNLTSCSQCQCDSLGTQLCNEADGTCQCRPNVAGTLCDRCDALYYPNPTIARCSPCPCHAIGSAGCTASGVCQCRANVTGGSCQECRTGYYQNPSLANCSLCTCDARRTRLCDQKSGRCICKPNVIGTTCGSCKEGFYFNSDVDACVRCSCHPKGTSRCNPYNGTCNCHPNIAGGFCHLCADNYYRNGSLPNCAPCPCNLNGTQMCDPFTGSCTCKRNVIGAHCDKCRANFFSPGSLDSCQACTCNRLGTDTCDGVSGVCTCNANVIGTRCTSCKNNFYRKPSLKNCVPCSCDSAGTALCNSTNGACNCKANVVGLHCDRCRAQYYTTTNLSHCTECGCNATGALRAACDLNTGQCLCRTGVTGRTCAQCSNGYYWPDREAQSCCGVCRTVFNTPCQECGCSAGADGTTCNSTGHCTCKAGHTGRKCDMCIDSSFIFLAGIGCTNPSPSFYPFGPQVGDRSIELSLSTSQVGSRLLRLPFGIPIGSSLERYSSVLISTGGFLTFSRLAPFFPPRAFPKGQPIFAPYWSITDLRCRGNVHYQIYESGSVVTRANNEVHTFGESDDTAFSARWVLVVTWKEVHAFPDNGIEEHSGPNSYQAIVATDGCVSYLMFHYLNGSIVWSGRFGIHARMGYTDAVGTPAFSYSHPSSNNANIELLDQSVSNTNTSGKWLWRVTASCTGVFLAQRKCLTWAASDRLAYPNVERYSLAAQPCPPTQNQARSDRRFVWWRYYSARRLCYRQRFGGVYQNTRVFGICCYNLRLEGSLSVGPPNGGFVTFPYNPRSVAFYSNDEANRILCCEDALICDVFYQRRPSDTGVRYIPPLWTWVFGDPHFRSLDGKAYTFNGWGEYMCFEGTLNNETIQVQCRTGRLSNPSSTATVFAAFAMGVRNSTGYALQSVQIDYNNITKALSVSVDNVDVTDNVTALNTSESLSFSHFDLSNDNVTLISVVFSSGVVVNISVTAPFVLAMSMSVPTEYMLNTKGLQGILNSNPSDDFEFRNRTMLLSNSSERQIFGFGQDWQLRADETLFAYPSGQTYLNYSYPDHVPRYSDEIDPALFVNFTTGCNNNSICLYDALESGDITLGQMSQSTTNSLSASESTAQNNPPVISGNRTIYATLGITLGFTFTASDSNTFSVSLNGTLPPSSDYNFSSILFNGTRTVSFYWTPSVDSVVTLRFEAADEAGATSTLLADVIFCGCLNNGTCIALTESDDIGDDQFFLQKCECSKAYNGSLCEADADGCLEENCYTGVNCTDVVAPGVGANCSNCPTGLTGDGATCTDLDECSDGSHSCDTNAACNNTAGSFACACSTGYTGNGINCTDIDECTQGGHDCHGNAACSNTNGSFVCRCLSGYIGDGIIECQDLDECARSTHDCSANAECTNINGSFTCACSSGYVGNGTACQDEDECTTGTHVCHALAECNNTIGSFSCSCSLGYEGSGEVCTDADECLYATHDCHVNGLCTNTNGSFSCACVDGFTGPGTNCTDVDECSAAVSVCGAKFTCDNSIGSFVCTCSSGYTGNSTYCEDFDECASNTHACTSNSICSNTEGGYNCTCSVGYAGDGTVFCSDIDECTVGMPCASNATCNNSIGSFSCTCDVGFTGSGLVCEDVNECVNSTCDSNATCTNTIGSFLCNCNYGLSGDGTYCVDLNECNLGTANCSARGSCSNIFGGFTCSCAVGYSGDGVTCVDVDECLSTPCDGNASCSNTMGSFTCSCDSGYTGSGLTCTDYDECMQLAHDCDTLAVCSNTVGSFSCSCVSGYSGNGTDCQDTDECETGSHGCAENATCSNTVGSFTCPCNSGFAGNATFCDDINECLTARDDCSPDASCSNTYGSHVCTCNSGYTGNGTSCQDVDECQTGNHGCSVNGSCENRIGTFSCRCNLGYAGNGITCSDSDECQTGQHSCHQQAKCSNTFGSFRCTCTSGFTGNGLTCGDVDECNTTGVCHTNGGCINTIGTFSCYCRPGYSGDGVSKCTDVDECLLSNPCSHLATCSNTDGSLICTCGAGYTGEGRQCLNIDECKQKNNCHANATCFDTEGSYYCTCNSGYVGTGDSCRASLLYPYGPRQGDTLLQFAAADGCSAALNTPFPVQFGSSKVTSVFVCENGIVSFRQPFHLFQPEAFPGSPTSSLRNSLISAPYWSDIDLSLGGSIYYHGYSNVTSNVGIRAMEAARNFSGLSSFQPLGIFVVTWDNVLPAGSSSGNPTNTFQCVLMADDVNTMGIYLFEPSRLNWAASGRSFAVSGVYAGGSSYENHPFSGSADIAQLDSTVGNTNLGLTGVYFYKISTAVVNQSSPYLTCLRFVQEDIQFFGSASNITNGTLTCPCSIGQVELDFRWDMVVANFTHICYMPRFTSTFEPVKNCCYTSGKQSRSGALISGQLYRYDPRVVKSLYARYDAAPYDACCGRSVLCARFTTRRPSDDCTGYVPPLLNIAWGDPHIKTLDGKSYTFNGLGEYVLFETADSSLSLQGRTQVVNMSTATSFSAVAMQQRSGATSPFVEIQLASNNTLVVLVNGSTIGSGPYSNVAFAYPQNDTSFIRVVFASGISVSVQVRVGTLAVVLSAPEQYKGATRGLYGPWNDNLSDEFTMRNGSILHVNSSESDLFIFGQSWQINSGESLFTYPSGLSVHNYSFPDHLPVFSDELDPSNFSSEIQAVCNGNPSCLYDALLSGNIALGQASMQVEMEVVLSSQALSNFPPAFSGSVLFPATLNILSTFSVNVTDAGSFTVALSGLAPGSFSLNVASGRATVTWTPTSSAPVLITLIATDEFNSSAELGLQVLLCACQHGDCLAASVAINTFTLNTCNCSSGYTGSLCDSDIDGCAVQGCFQGVTCTDNAAPATGYSCGSCPSGLSGDGVRCQDIDECATGLHNCGQRCVNSFQNFSCSCNSGYQLAGNGLTCNDIDECSYNPCHQVCSNTAGSYQCSCTTGFTLDTDDNTTCNATTACTSANSCTQVCAVISGVNVCSCSPGYMLQAPATCNDIDECLGNTPCTQLCNNTVGAYFCSCNHGYRLDADTVTCNDVNECSNTLACPSSQLCSNIPGSFVCNCPPGATLITANSTCATIPQATVPPSTMAASTTTVTVAATTSATRTTRTTSTVSPNGVPVAFPDLSVNVIMTNLARLIETIRNATISLCKTSLSCFGGNVTAIDNMQVIFQQVQAASGQNGTSLVISMQAFGSSLSASLVSTILHSSLVSSRLTAGGFGAINVSLVDDGSTRDDSSSSTPIGAIVGGTIGGIVVVIGMAFAVKYKMTSGGVSFNTRRRSYSSGRRNSLWEKPRNLSFKIRKARKSETSLEVPKNVFNAVSASAVQGETFQPGSNQQSPVAVGNVYSDQPQAAASSDIYTQPATAVAEANFSKPPVSHPSSPAPSPPSSFMDDSRLEAVSAVAEVHLPSATGDLGQNVDYINAAAELNL